MSITTFTTVVEKTCSTYSLPQGVSHQLCTIGDFFDRIELRAGGGTNFKSVIDVAMQLIGLNIFITDGEGGTYAEICTPANKGVFDFGFIIGYTNKEVVEHLCQTVIYCNSKQELEDELLVVTAGITRTQTHTVTVPSNVTITHPTAKLVTGNNVDIKSQAGARISHKISDNIFKLETENNAEVLSLHCVNLFIDISGSMDSDCEELQTMELPSAITHPETIVADVISDIHTVTAVEDSGLRVYEITYDTRKPAFYYLKGLLHDDQVLVDGSVVARETDVTEPLIVRMMQEIQKLHHILNVLRTTDVRVMWRKFVKEAVAYLRELTFVEFVKELEAMVNDTEFQVKYLEFTTLIQNILELEKLTLTVADVDMARRTAINLGNGRNLTAQAMRLASGTTRRQASDMLESSSMPIITENDENEDEDGDVEVEDDDLLGEETVCLVCLSNYPTVMNLACGHVSMCTECAPSVICGTRAVNTPFTPTTSCNVENNGCPICRAPTDQLVFLEQEQSDCMCGAVATIVSLDCKHKAFCDSCHHQNLRAKRQGIPLPYHCGCGVPCTATIRGFW